LSAADWDEIIEVAKIIGSSQLIIEDTLDLSIEELIRYQSIEHIGMSKEEIIKYLIIKFKTMSDAFDIPVVLCLEEETYKITEPYIKEYAHRVKSIQEAKSIV